MAGGSWLELEPVLAFFLLNIRFIRDMMTWGALVMRESVSAVTACTERGLGMRFLMVGCWVVKIRAAGYLVSILDIKKAEKLDERATYRFIYSEVAVHVTIDARLHGRHQALNKLPSEGER